MQENGSTVSVLLNLTRLGADNLGPNGMATFPIPLLGYRPFLLSSKSELM